MSADPPSIERGDAHRVTSGKHKRKTGAILRIIEANETRGTSAMALVILQGGNADYFNIGELEKAKSGNTPDAA